MEKSGGRIEIRMNLSTFYTIVRHIIGVCCDQPVHLCPAVCCLFARILWKSLACSFWSHPACLFRSNRFVFTTNGRILAYAIIWIHANALRNCTFLALKITDTRHITRLCSGSCLSSSVDFEIALCWLSAPPSNFQLRSLIWKFWRRRKRKIVAELKQYDIFMQKIAPFFPGAQLRY